MAGVTCYRCGYPYCVSGRNCPNCGASVGCFITTATCLTLQKPDNCEELMVLRHFRDTYMSSSSELKAEVEEYYQIAPVIVEGIEAVPDKGKLEYQRIWSEYLQPSVAAAKVARNQEAHDLYKNMVLDLSKKYL